MPNPDNSEFPKPWAGFRTADHRGSGFNEMLRQVDLGSPTLKVPLFIPDIQYFSPNPSDWPDEPRGFRRITDHAMLVSAKDGEPLKVVSDQWKPLQNFEALSRFCENFKMVPDRWEPLHNFETLSRFCEDFPESDGMQIEAVGTLDKGSLAWALIRTPVIDQVAEDDWILGYLLARSSQKYGTGTIFEGLAVRVATWTTYSLKYRVPIARLPQRYDRDKTSDHLNKLKGLLSEFAEKAHFLNAKLCSPETLRDYLSHWMPVTGKERRGLSENAEYALKFLEEEHNIARSRHSHPHHKTSWWKAWNAYAYMVDHTFSRDDETRLYNAWIGLMRTKKRKAFDMAVEKAENSPPIKESDYPHSRRDY